MAQAGRSNGEGAEDRLDWHRRLCKAQRARLTYRLTMMERRIREAQVGDDEWAAQRSPGKKPGLDFYDARWR